MKPRIVLFVGALVCVAMSYGFSGCVPPEAVLPAKDDMTTPAPTGETRYDGKPVTLSGVQVEQIQQGQGGTVCVDDGDCVPENPCLIGLCISDMCQVIQIPCIDADPCTTDECVVDAQTGAPFCSHVDFSEECDDGIDCTIDVCEPQNSGECKNLCTTDNCCDDGDACTDNVCGDQFECEYPAINCDDGDACTADSCDPASGCVHDPIVCDDGDACTTDSCDPAAGCVAVALNCADGDACTTDECVDGSCVNDPVVCDEGQNCVDGECVDKCPQETIDQCCEECPEPETCESLNCAANCDPCDSCCPDPLTCEDLDCPADCENDCPVDCEADCPCVQQSDSWDCRQHVVEGCAAPDDCETVLDLLVNTDNEPNCGGLSALCEWLDEQPGYSCSAD